MTQYETVKQTVQKHGAVSTSQLVDLLGLKYQSATKALRRLFARGEAQKEMAESSGGKGENVAVAPGHSRVSLTHDLAVTDVAVWLLRACRKRHGFTYEVRTVSFDRVLPDLCVIIGRTDTNESCSVFIEWDGGTEPKRRVGLGSSIDDKLSKYADLLRSGEYRKAGLPSGGFRVLLITNAESRFRTLCRSGCAAGGHFVWVSSLGRVSQHGIDGAVWQRGGRDGEPESIFPSS